MAITTLAEAIAEIKRLSLLVVALQNKINELQTAFTHVATREQVSAINLISQKTQDEQDSKIEDHEARITSLEDSN
jgi:hypothetical protein